MDTDLKIPKVTVSMPVYNGEKYIAESIKSILNQTFEDFELLIIDDGSTDGTMKIVESFRDTRIRIVRNPRNLGIVATRNTGLKESRGDYIAILDSDDVAMPKRLEYQIKFLDNHKDFAIVGSDVELIGSTGQPSGHSWREHLKPEQIPIFLLFHNCFAQSAVMLRKSLLPKDGYREGFAPAEDYELWNRIIEKHRGYNIPKILIKYRRHESSASNTKRAIQQEAVEKIIKNQIARLGVSPTDQEFEIHKTNDTYNGPDIKSFLEKREGWLKKLTDANLTTKVYDTKIFSTSISILWLNSCKANTALGFYVWKKFWSSELSCSLPFKENFLKLIKFFVKCLIRRDDR